MKQSATMNTLVIFAVLICLAACQSINDCPAGVPRDYYLRAFGGSCFQFVLSRQRTHSQARRDCETHGGTLALVKSQATQDFLVNTLTSDYHDFYDKLWIGLNDIDVENEFKWEDGTPLAYSNWDQGEGPSSTTWGHNWNHDENDCVVMDVENDGKWGEYPCEESSYLLFLSEDEEHSYVCQYALVPSWSTTVEMTTTTNGAVSGSADTTTTTNTAVSGSADTTTTTNTAVSGSADTTTTTNTAVSGSADTTTTTNTAVSGSAGTTVEMTTTTNAAVSGIADTTVVVLTNPCPAFSCDLDCGTHGFQKNSTTGCYNCQCST